MSRGPLRGATRAGMLLNSTWDGLLHPLSDAHALSCTVHVANLQTTEAD